MKRLKQLLAASLLLPASVIICSAQTTTVFDNLVATGTLTVIGTTTLQGNAFSVGGSTLVVNHGNIGIGTSTPSALFHAVGSPISGSGSQFKWFASSGALRVGEVTGTAWDRIGLFSVALGLDNESKGAYSSVSGGHLNTTASSYTVIGGGFTNSISSGVNSTGFYTVISGGVLNDSRYFARNGFIGGGAGNSIQDEGSAIVSGLNNISSGYYSFVGGGGSNTADGLQSVVVGGGSNVLSSCDYCAIGGGGGNNATGAAGAVIAGGGINSALMTLGNAAGGISSSILGGAGNSATGDYSSVLGGLSNSATGIYAVASGLRASAAGKGTFVWADSQNSPVTATTHDEFRARAGGGFVLLSTPTAATIIVSSGAIIISTSATAASAVPNIFISSVTGNVGIGTNSPATTLAVSGSAQFGSGATKSTFTASGLLQLTASGIQWADGSISTTAATGGSSGNASESGTNNMTGATYWTAGSTLAVNQSSTTSGTTVTIGNSPRVSGMWYVLASSSPAGGSSTITFAGLKSSTTYRLEFTGIHKTGSADLYYRFNGDTGANYKYVTTYSALGSFGSQYSNSGTQCFLTPGNGTDFWENLDFGIGSVTFSTNYSNSNQVTSRGQAAVHSAGRNIASAMNGACNYYGSANLTSITLLPSTGVLIGDIRLLELGK